MHVATCSHAENVAKHQQEASGEAFRDYENVFEGAIEFCTQIARSSAIGEI